ncbi:MAG: lamin tail domain-containing protein [Chloroflexi bacterium]|nr:MAG: lamin tail domain-containing protein [Chloroflexota bacterium]MBL1195398.1 lamin tail domain-containing protein [Chloroflexota bacterium]NOH12681.1 lamin tail domain-containing protein [Chloroflexota bacterium]
MKNWRRLGSYLLLNVIVSAVTVLLVLWLFGDRFQPAVPIDDLPDVPVSENGEQPVPEDSVAGGNLSGQLEIASVVGAGDLENEHVLIRHIGDQELSLENWQLQDSQGNSFLFPALTMINGGAVTVFTQPGATTVVELYWGLDVPIWEEGEQASLLDPDGTVQATFTVP